jgi:uncharacterized repeat protein (TIGR03803 family)
MARSGFQLNTIALKTPELVRVAILMVLLSMAALQAQTFAVLHSFSFESSAGFEPAAGLTIDAAGNLYGTTLLGGHSQTQYCPQEGCGTVFRLTYKNGAWLLSTLYSFEGGSDGSRPAARVTFGPDGSLYGTTEGSESTCMAQGDCGTIFRLMPPLSPCRSFNCPWTKTVLYRFGGGPDGSLPGYGDLAFDGQGDIYGTTQAGGAYGNGTVFELTRQNGRWAESVLYSFAGLDGSSPIGGLILDPSGNIYGTTAYGGPGYHPPQYGGAGVIFELVPAVHGWSETALFSFHDDARGALPYSALTLDAAGNFYGTTGAGGQSFCYQETEMYGGCGTVFALATYPNPLYSFPGNYQFGLPAGPQAAVVEDAGGNLYGTYYGDCVSDFGGVFELTAGSRDYVPLHVFSGGADGNCPISNVAMDSGGNLYGTATEGGSSPGGGGVVWEITP